jgi:hypothetical protein
MTDCTPINMQGGKGFLYVPVVARWWRCTGSRMLEQTIMTKSLNASHC